MKKPSLELLSPYLASRNLSVITGQVLVVLMMVTIGVGFAQLGSRLVTGWNPGYLVGVALFASLEALLVRKHAADLEGRDKIIFRLSEWVAFAVAIKLLLYVINGFDQLLVDLPRWQEDFLRGFITPEYFVALVVALIAWWSSGSYARELEELYDRESDASWDELGKVQNALHSMRARIATRVFALGALVVFLAVLTRIDASAIFRQGGPRPPGYTAPVANVLFYFILALVLLTQTQFALMRTRWLWQRVPISPQIAKNWFRYGLAFFAVLGIVVFFLPTEYSLGLFDTLRVAFDYLLQGASLLMFLLMLPFTLCMSLFRLAGGEGTNSPMEPFTAPPPPPSGTPLSWLEFVRSLLFWALFLGVIFFAIRYYLGQNTALWKAIRAFPLVRWLASAWTALSKWLRGANRQVASLVREGMRRLRPRQGVDPTRAVRRLINLARMSPREKIIHFYTSLIDLGGERGLERRPHQTPYQYENRLAGAIPEIDQDLHSLTDTFLEARYSPHPMAEPQAEQAGSLWDRIKAILRSWKRSE